MSKPHDDLRDIAKNLKLEAELVFGKIEILKKLMQVPDDQWSEAEDILLTKLVSLN